MPSNRLGKVQKQIAKKKGKNAVLHDKSRDTYRLQRASIRDDKLNRLASVRQKQNLPFLERIEFFKEAAIEHDGVYTLEEVHILIETYIQRNDEEIASLKAERRSGRPPSTRETLLKERQASEQKEYASGFWAPDMEDLGNVNKLKDWNGEWVNLNMLKFVRITKDGVKHESSFPPKGRS